MRRIKLLGALAACGILLAGSVTLTSRPAMAIPQPDNCTEHCRPFLKFGDMKCPFVGCDVDGVCRYIC